MLEVASFVGVDEIVLLGDYADYYSVSSHSRHPLLPQMLDEEVESVNQGLDEFDRHFPKAKKVYLEGNHEFRLERYLTERAPALFGLTSCQDLFRISARSLWSYLDYQKNQAYRVLGSDLLARHTPLAGNVKSGLQRAGSSYCYGHNHQIELAHTRTLDGKSLVAFSPGWLGDPRLKAFDYLSLPPNWAWGFALVSVTGPSKTFHHEIVHIKNNFECITHGKRFKA